MSQGEQTSWSNNAVYAACLYLALFFFAPIAYYRNSFEPSFNLTVFDFNLPATTPNPYEAEWKMGVTDFHDGVKYLILHTYALVTGFGTISGPLMHQVDWAIMSLSLSLSSELRSTSTGWCCIHAFSELL